MKQNKEDDDKHNLREILVANGAFTPNTLQALTKHIDLLIKVEFMKCQQNE